MNIAKKILNIVIDVLLFLLLCITIVVVVSTVNGQKNEYGYQSAFGYSFATVQTPSMSGTFETGDLIITKVAKDNNEYNVGDIITYGSLIQGVDTTVTHRIYEIDGEKIYTKGDANTLQDEGYITKDKILGVYIGRIKGVGNFITFIKKPIGFILCVVVPIVIFIAYEAICLFKIYMLNKKKEMVDAAKDSTSDDVKEAIIREYLLKKQEEEYNSTSGSKDK